MELINGVETVSGASIVGITIDNTPIGQTTAAAGTFTTLSADSIADLDSIALFDSNDTHSLTITWDENDTANRTLKLKVSAGNRVLTLTGDATIADWFDQGVKAADSPAFQAITLTTDLAVGDGGTGTGTHTVHGVLIGQTTSAIAATAAGSVGEVLTSNGASADPTFQAGATGGNAWTVATKTADYTVTTDDFDKTIRMNSASATIATLPSVGATEDGKVINIVKQGAGQVTVATADTDIIDSGSAGGTLINSQAGEIYASVTLMYLHATVTWIIIGARGTWSTS